MRVRTFFFSLLLVVTLTACAADSPSQTAPDAAEDGAGGNTAGDVAPSSEGPSSETSPGLLSSFSTTDLEGNTVDQSVLEGYDLTMVNVWATYCSPCLQEMPDLGELAAEYKEEGVQIIGLVSDVLNSDGTVSDSQVETAQEIVAETGADYLHLMPSADLMGLLSQIYGVPTTFFVDSEGNQVGYAYVTALSREQFVEIIDSALTEVTA